jgi:hypothetical protein
MLKKNLLRFFKLILWLWLFMGVISIQQNAKLTEAESLGI